MSSFVPLSPFVQTTVRTVAFSRVQRAMLPPADSSASSGWATTTSMFLNSSWLTCVSFSLMGSGSVW